MPSYLLTFRTYGTWLHGQEGSVDDEHNTPGTPTLPVNPRRALYEHGLLKHDPIELDAQRRWVVARTIEEVCAHRTWRLHALNVRTTHVHVIVSADKSPETTTVDLKAWCTRRMRESGVMGKDMTAWEEHGSTRWLNTDAQFQRAMTYVLKEQGPDLPQIQPPGWKGNGAKG